MTVVSVSLALVWSVCLDSMTIVLGHTQLLSEHDLTVTLDATQAWHKLLGAINFPLPMGLHPQKVRPWRCGSKEVPHHGDRSEVGLEVRMRLLEQAQLYLLPERTFQLQYGCQGELKRVAPPWGTLPGVCH